MRTSCLYARGLTPAWTGSVTGTPAQIEASLKPDQSRFTSLVYDGYGQGYVCGFGSVFMNGQFPTAGSFRINQTFGWMGDYSRDDVNSVGVIRHLMTNIRFVTHAYRGLDWLVISDTDGLRDTTSMAGWGQFCRFLKKQGVSTLLHTPQDITNGAYGWDTRPEYFMQFAGVILLLSGSKALPNNITQAITGAISLGASFVILQKNNIEGRAPVNAILEPIGIVQDQPGYLAPFSSSVSTSKTLYKNHVSWTKIESLHPQTTHRISATYKVLATGKGTVDSVDGQPGKWEAIYCKEVTDETPIRNPIFYQEDCCVQPGTGYEARFDAPVFPIKPTNHDRMFKEGYLKVDWTSKNSLPLAQRSLISFDVRGKNLLNEPSWKSTATLRDRVVDLQQGYTVIQLDSYLRTKDVKRFNTAQGGQGSVAGIKAAQDMAAYINSIPDGTYVIVVSHDNAWTNRLTPGLPKAMYSLGASSLCWEASYFKSGAAYLLFGTKGSVEGNALIEMYYLPRKLNNAIQPIRFTTGFNLTDEDIPYCCGTDQLSRNTIEITGLINNGQYARLKYFKQLSEVDNAKKYGIEHTTLIKDTRFKKLVLEDKKNTVVSVENPCMPIRTYNPELDWVRVRDFGKGVGSFNYPMKDQHEYIFVFKDNSQNIVQWHYSFDNRMYSAYGQTLESISRHCMVRIRGRNTFNFEQSGGLWLQLYERPQPILPKNSEVEEDTNNFVLEREGHEYSRTHRAAMGYEYIVKTDDPDGSNEYVQHRVFLPPANLFPTWNTGGSGADGPLRYVGTTNNLDMRLIRSNLVFTAGHMGNTFHRVQRRPVFITTDRESQTGWFVDYFTGNTKCPTGSNIPFKMERDREYQIFAVGTARYSNGTLITPELMFKMRETGVWAQGRSLETYDVGCISASYDMQRIINQPGIYTRVWKGKTDGRNGSWYWYDLPQSCYLVLSRKMVSWTPEEVAEFTRTA